jgi:hypothetical protein
MKGDLLRGLIAALALGWSLPLAAQTPPAGATAAPAAAPAQPAPALAPPARPAAPAAPPSATPGGVPVAQPNAAAAQPAGVATPQGSTTVPPQSTAEPAITAAPPAAPAAEPVYMGTLQAPPVAAGEAACVPACRLGYTCQTGRCVPGCNPPCGPRDRCTEAGRCEAIEAPVKPGASTHDGLLVRVTNGFTWGNLSVDSNEGTKSDTAIWSDLTVDVGAAVIPNFIVRGRLWAASAGFSDGPFGEQSLAVTGGLGAGADYYFMPINVYVGASLGLAGLANIDIEDLDEEREGRGRASKAGLWLDLGVGKEWWVSGNWGLGLGLRLRYLNIAPANIAAPTTGNLNSFQGGLNFTVTYN